MRRIRLSLAVLIAAMLGPAAFADTAVRLPDEVAGPTGSDVVVRIAADTGGDDLASLDLALTFDDDVLELRAIHRAQWTRTFTLLSNHVEDPSGPDTLDLGLYTGTPVPSPAGFRDVVLVVFRVRSHPDLSALLWDPAETWVNDTVPARIENGSVATDGASVAFLMPDDATGAPTGPASSVWVPVLVDPVDGLHSFDVEVRFDPEVIEAVDAVVAPATNDFTLTRNLTTPGRVNLSLFDVYPLSTTGRQAIARILFHVVGGVGDDTPLDLTVGITDDGYSTYLDDGRFTVCADADLDGFTACGGDCDDTDAATYPGAEDSSCDGIDQNCSGLPDDEYVPEDTLCGLGVCAADGRTSCVDGAVVDSCVEGPPTGDDTDCDGLDDDCDGAPDNHYVTRPTTCGVGACGAAGAMSCIDSVEVDSCVPGDPTPEVCNGVDDDCNAIVDDEPAATASCDDADPCTADTCSVGACLYSPGPIVVSTTCDIVPTTLNVKAASDPFTINTRVSDQCTGGPLVPTLLGTAWIAAVASPTIGTIVLPTPSSAPGCDSFTQDGLWETRADRVITGNGGAKFRFNVPSDGNCETEDGDRQDIIALLLDVPDGETANLCFEAVYPGAVWRASCCAPVGVNNQGAR